MENKNTYNHVDWEAISRYLSGEMSGQELERFTQLLLSNAEYAEAVSASKKDMNHVERIHTSTQTFNKQEAWKKLQQRLQMEAEIVPVKTTLKGWKKVKVAAVLLAIVTFGFGGYLIFNAVVKPETTVVAEWNDMGNVIVLPDGSEAMLNAGASITYPQKFKNDTRTIQLSGEAFFSIQRDEQKPFIVQTSKVEVKVLGTRFNVISTSNKTEVLVESGKVQVSMAKQKSKSLMLTQGDFCKAEENLLKVENKNPNYLSWKTQKMIFDATPMNEVAKIIEKTYGVKIKISDNSIKNLQLTSTFDHEPLDIILESISKSFNLTYEKNGRSILLKK